MKHETPKAILKLIQDKKLQPGTLKPSSRRLCVEYLDASGWSEMSIAALLEVHRNTIYKDLKLIYQRHGNIVLTTKFEHILGRLMAVKKQVQEKLSAQKKWKDVWLVEKEFLEKLQGLGVVFKQPEEIIVTDERKQYINMYANSSTEQISNRIKELEALEVGRPN